MLFAFKVGLRYFHGGGSQTWLTVASVAFGVTVYLFISSLIYGLQSGLIQRTIGSTSHVTVQPLEAEARVLNLPNTRNLADQQPFNERQTNIKGYSAMLTQLDSVPGVTAVSPLSAGPGFALRGGQSRPISILGIDEDRGNQILDLRAAMKSGTLDLGGQGCAIGVELARLLDLKVGDKVRVLSARRVEQVFRINGIFEAGQIVVNERSFYVSLTNGQRLNDMIGAVSEIEMKVAEPFQADPIVQEVKGITGLKIQSWKEVNTELLGALSAQNQTTSIIRVFTMILVATSVASVLIVSVIQRSREIGILKSMGASTRTLQFVFIVLGALVGLSGAMVGAGFGGAMVVLLAQIPGNNPIRPGYALPIDMQLRFVVESFLVAFLIGSLAAILPARRAALMNPVDVIRQG